MGIVEVEPRQRHPGEKKKRWRWRWRVEVSMAVRERARRRFIVRARVNAQSLRHGRNFLFLRRFGASAGGAREGFRALNSGYLSPGASPREERGGERSPSKTLEEWWCVAGGEGEAEDDGGRDREGGDTSQTYL
jgi:hypothetical protein